MRAKSAGRRESSTASGSSRRYRSCIHARVQPATAEIFFSSFVSSNPHTGPLSARNRPRQPAIWSSMKSRGESAGRFPGGCNPEVVRCSTALTALRWIRSGAAVTTLRRRSYSKCPSLRKNRAPSLPLRVFFSGSAAEAGGTRSSARRVSASSSLRRYCSPMLPACRGETGGSEKINTDSGFPSRYNPFA